METVRATSVKPSATMPGELKNSPITSIRSPVKPVSSSSSLIAVSSTPLSSSSPTSPAGSSMAFAIAQRHARLLDQHHLAVMFGQDDDAHGRRRSARHIPSGHRGRCGYICLPTRRWIAGHSSISLSGNFVRVLAALGEMLGQHLADHLHRRDDAVARPPCFTSVSSAAIASPQVSGVVTE